MSNPLKVLLIEDSEDDAELLKIGLRKAAFDQLELKRVDTLEDYQASLDKEDWDVIISDYNVPGFSVPRSLDILHISGKDLPFIVISGVVGEEMAVDVMRAGAQDFIRKDNLSRLVPAIVRERHELEERNKRKAAEKELARSEERFWELFQSATDVIMVVDRNGKILNANRSAEILSGYSVPHILSMNIADGLFVEEESGSIALILQRLREGNYQSFELSWVAVDGEVHYFVGNATPRYDEEGHFLFSLFILRDITNRKKAEEALAAEKELLAVTLRSIGEAVISCDTSGRVIMLNKVAEELTDWKSEDAKGKDLKEVFKLYHEYTGEQYVSPVATVLYQQTSVNFTPFNKLVSNNGKERVISSRGTPLRDKNGNIIGAVIVFRDITEQQIMERELQRTQRLESIAVLAGGISHDFNNILTAILGNISLAKSYVDKDSKIFERLFRAEKAAFQAKDLTDKLLTFSKGGAPVKRTSSIEEIVRDSVSFILTGSGVKSQLEFEDQLWPVEVDVGQINQVINNLVINAVQAMPGGGTITIKVENVKVDEPTHLPLSPGRYVKISVIDEGVGIPEHELQKIFDPYFTTKAQGSGLGLAIVYSIIKKHEGFIGVESEINKGTTFYFYLPASQKTADVENGTEKVSVVRGCNVLVMDDEEVVQDVVGEMLASLGCQVSFAFNGQEAIEKYKGALDSGSPFDIIIMDLTIPGGMGGKEAIHKLRQIDPAVKAVVSSGYSNEPVMANYRDHGFTGVLAKPYKLNELSSILNSLFPSGKD